MAGRRLDAYAMGLGPLDAPSSPQTQLTDIADSHFKLRKFAQQHTITQPHAHAHTQQRNKLDALKHFVQQVQNMQAHATQAGNNLEALIQQLNDTRQQATPSLENFQAQQKKRREEAEARAAAEARLLPLREARAAASVALNPAAAAAAATRPYSLSHPLMRALVAIDSAIASLPSDATELEEVQALRSRTIQLITSLHICRPLSEIAAQLSISIMTDEAPKEEASSEAGGSDSADATLKRGVNESEKAPNLPVDVRFATVTARLRPWVSEIETRNVSNAQNSASVVDARGASAALKVAHNEFWQARNKLVQLPLRDSLESIIRLETLNIPRVFRRCCSQSLHMCRAESRLYDSLFTSNAMSSMRGPETLNDAAKVNALETLFSPLYSFLRPIILRQSDIDPLCHVISVIQDEVSEEARHAGQPGQAIERITRRLLADARERLTYRVQTFVHDRLRGRAHPSQDRLTQGERFARHPAIVEGLDCLAKVYRCLPREIFKSLSQEVLAECTESALRASAEAGAERVEHSAARAQLYLLSQLLGLREQIGQFDSDFAITWKTLDFTQTREALRAFVARREQLNGVSTVMELLQRSAPSTIESHLDAKAKLEKELRRVAESFIRDTAAYCTNPLVKLMQDALSSGAKEENLARGDLEAALKQAEAALVDKVTPACELARAAFPEASTHGILFAPIKTSIVDVLGQLQTLLNAAGAHSDLVPRLMTLSENLDVITQVQSREMTGHQRGGASGEDSKSRGNEET